MWGPRQRAGHRGRVAGLHADIHHGHGAGLDGGDRSSKDALKFGGVVHWAEALGTLRLRQSRQIDVRVADTHADPLVVDWTIAHAGNALLMDLVIEERLVVRHDDQERDAVMSGRP